MANNSMNDLIVQFAILWGEKIGSAILSSKEMRLAEEMKQYNSEELVLIFSDWAKEFDSSNENDSVSFFEERVTELMHEL